MIVEVKDLEQRTFSPVGSEASFDGRFVSSFGENQPTQYVERREAGVGGGSTILPFQISATPALLRAEPGIVGTTSIPPREVPNPADGTWHFYAKVVINAATGAKVSENALWGDTLPADTATDYHREIASVQIADGEILGPPLTLQYTYGPIWVVVGGGFDSVWTVRIY
jgi:hypothetical protein